MAEAVAPYASPRRHDVMRRTAQCTTARRAESAVSECPRRLCAADKAELDRVFGHRQRLCLILAVADDLGKRGDTHSEAAFGSGRSTIVYVLSIRSALSCDLIVMVRAEALRCQFRMHGRPASAVSPTVGKAMPCRGRRRAALARDGKAQGAREHAAATPAPAAPRSAACRHRAPAVRRRRHALDGAVPGDQGRQSGLPAVLPDGRLLRAVLRGCGGRRRRRSASC